MADIKSLSVAKQQLFDFLSEQLKDFIATTPIYDPEDVILRNFGPVQCDKCGNWEREFSVVIDLGGSGEG